MPSADPDRPVPSIHILMLGDVDVGKSTFISQLPSVQHPSVGRRPSSTSTSESLEPLDRTASVTSLPAYINAGVAPPPYSPDQSIPPVVNRSDRQAKYEFNVSLFARPYQITLHTNTGSLIASPGDSLPDQFRLAVFVFSIPSRTSLNNVVNYWAKRFHLLYPSFSGPILLLGLKRDLRTNKQVPATVGDSEVPDGVRHGVGAYAPNATGSSKGAKGNGKMQFECVMPREGLQAARTLRADGYAECSAKTGELMFEVLEDLTKMAANAAVRKGQAPAAAGTGCVLM